MNFWRLDIIQHSITLEINRSILERWTKCVKEYFTAENAAKRAERPPGTTLTSFFETWASSPFARTLLYSEMPEYSTWNASSKKFERRKQGQPVPGYVNMYSTDALGRIYTLHLRNDECFYLRLLLVKCSWTDFIPISTKRLWWIVRNI